MTDDVDGAPRLRPDIGADEFIPSDLYRSVGTNAGSLASGVGNALTISGSTATFAGALPGNVGVGDVIQYDSDGNNSIDALAFVHRRTSPLTYIVKSKNGDTPTPVIGDNNWAIYRAYTSLSSWESQLENGNILEPVENDVNPSPDLVTSGTVMNVACYGDGVDTTPVVVSGWTTAASNYVRIYTPASPTEVGTSQRHPGRWDTSRYRLEAPSDVLAISDNYVRVEGLQVYVTANIANNEGIGFSRTPDSGASYYEVSGNIVRGTPGNQDARIGINPYNAGSGVIKIWNNLVYDFSGNTNFTAGILLDDANFTHYVYNNTVVDCGNGIYAANGTVVAKNNLVHGNADNYFPLVAFNASSTNNLSGPAQADAPGANPRNAAPVTFANAAGDDFHLASADTGARGRAADLTADPSLAFAVDVDREPRLAPWDIGADELAVTQLYRSVGDTVAPYYLASGTTNALTISGSTATFASALPGNVGVGDVIQYDKDGGGAVDTVAFIHGRTDSRTYTVKDASGATPTAMTVPGDNDWLIVRAYTTLANWESHTESTYVNPGLMVFDTAATRADLVTNATTMNVACYVDVGTANTADQTAVTISGWTTGPDNYISIFTPYASFQVGTSQRHSGVWDPTKYRISVSLAGGIGAPIWIQEEFVRVAGLQIENTLNKGGGNNPHAIRVNPGSAPADVRLSHNILRNPDADVGTWQAAAVHHVINAVGDLKAWNNLIYGWGAGFFIEYSNQTTNVALYSNTVVGNDDSGIELDGHAGGTYRLANNLVVGTTVDDYYLAAGVLPLTYSATNVSADGSSPNGAAFQNQTVTFVGAPNYHLGASDSAARDRGTPLQSDPVLAVLDDIDGQVRAAPWDIGADDASGTTAVGADVVHGAAGRRRGRPLVADGLRSGQPRLPRLTARSRRGARGRDSRRPSFPGQGFSATGASYCLA